MKHLVSLFLGLLCAVSLYAQPTARQFSYVNVDPAGACTNGTANRYNYVLGKEWGCKAGVWTTLATGGGGSSGDGASQALSGCGVEYVSGLTFNVQSCTYMISGIEHISVLTQITLAAADMTNPRIDVIYVDNTGSVAVLQGTPAATPAQRTVDYSTELPLNFVLVPAGSSVPGGIVATTIYDENTEWTSTCGTNFNCASTSNPYRGTKDIEATIAVLGNNFTLVKPAAGTTDLSTQNTLVLYIRSKATWPTANNAGASGLRTLSLFWLSGSTQVGLQVVIRSGTFNFDSSITNAYQQINIPISLFGTGSTTVTTLKAQITGNGGSSSIGFYIDSVSLQSGTGMITLPETLMNFKGVWNSTANYNVNDTVAGPTGLLYVAKIANTNVALTTAATWSGVAGTTGTGNAVFSASPTFTGSPLAPTQSGNDNSTKLATTAYVDKGVAFATPGTSHTFAGNYDIFVCTSTCTITVPVPTGPPNTQQFCVMNGDNVATVITLSAIGSSARYENQARTAYGTAGTGTLVSAGATKDYVCILGLDSTHYLFASGNGTWTVN